MSRAMNYEVVSKEICRLAELTNNWSSTIIIPQGDAFLNISSAAQGKLSVTPDGATNQPNVYPKGQSPSLYRFDPDIFGENDWPKLKGMLCKVGCVSGCKLTTQHSSPSHSRQTRKATYYLSCTHAIKGRLSGSSIFNDDDIGPMNVVTEQIKRTKTKGSLKGNIEICFIFERLLYIRIHVVQFGYYSSVLYEFV
jgi:hypothetical protein